MNNQPIDPEQESKLAAFRVKKAQLKKDLSHLAHDDMTGYTLGPKNQAELKETLKDFEGNDSETNEEDLKNG